MDVEGRATHGAKAEMAGAEKLRPCFFCIRYLRVTYPETGKLNLQLPTNPKPSPSMAYGFRRPCSE